MLILLASPMGAEARGAGEALSDAALVRALREGGYVLYFRHAPTGWDDSDRIEAEGDWRSCDPARMRQLSEEGRRIARRIGEAMRALAIPVARVLSSEYCRAAETARLLDLGPVETTTAIMNLRAAEYVGGRGAAVRRARAVLATPPADGTNTVVIGHGNLMRAAIGAYAGEGGSVVLAPDPDDPRGFVTAARPSSADWTRLAGRYAGDDVGAGR